MKKVLLIILIVASISISQELVIGEERIEPGIVFIFEGAVKDHIMPLGMHLEENQTHVHIEARVNWDEKNIPDGTPPGGFVPYLHVTSKVTNQRTGMSTYIDLVPHINLIDNFHYARNISLPGKDTDFYTVDFFITPPAPVELALHRDWLEGYGQKVMSQSQFTYKDVYFEEICGASRTVIKKK